MSILSPLSGPHCSARHAFPRLAAFCFSLFQLLLPTLLLTAGSSPVLAQTATLNLSAGWNLVGNSSAAPVEVTATFNDPAKITTVWSWNKTAGKWAFYAPSMTPADLTTYAQGKGYEVLTRIAPKEGYWVNASVPAAIDPALSGAMTLVESDLQPGWNLVSSADAKSPSQLHQALDRSLNAAGKAITTVWAWDTPTSNWRFFAPALEAKGGTELTDYITGKAYAPFGAALSATEGFWINVGTTSSAATADSLALDMRSPFGPDNVYAVSRALGLAGIAVYPDDVVPPVGVVATYTGARMLKSQARGLAMELSAGAGFTGAFLNSKTPLLPFEDGTQVPVSQLLAAYIARADTYGAKQIRALLPGFDPAKHLDTQFPTIAIVFFMKEFVVPFLAAAQNPDAVIMASSAMLAIKKSSALGAADPCGAVSEFLDDLPSAVEDAVQDLIDPGHSSIFLGIVSSVVGGVVQLAVDGAKNLIRNTPLVSSMREVANILGGLTDMQSMFSQWTVNIAAPTGLHKVPGTPNSGQFTLTMDNGGDGFDWPQAVRSCSELLNVPLPEINSADGATVTWHKISGFEQLASKTGSVDVIAGNKASYSVATATEDTALHNGGGPTDKGPLAVKADVQMPGVERLAERIGSLMSSVGQAAVSTATAMAPHIGPSGNGVGEVEFHTPATARINFNGATERLIVSSPDGISPNGTWTGTFASQQNSQCGGWVETPVSWTFANGSASLSVNLSFPGSAAFFVEACSFSFTETLTLGSSDQGPFMTTSGTWNSMFDPGQAGIDIPETDPPYEMPPVTSTGPRGESYVIELVGAAP